ncbi:MAG: hypothetical protein AMJ94_18090 [Deltaproteobacteria bacterium SM23_61]|nr:MAG: hypothetical protein AMJ94_18090 [Deltaproteobacteria bacterium SM23_61]
MASNKGIDWSSLWKKEDWWACWIGWFLLLLAIVALLPALPKLAKWTEIAQAFPRGAVAFWSLTKLFLILVILTSIGAAAMKKSVKAYIPGFLAIYIIALVALVVSNQKQIHMYGFEYVLWALIIGLIISNLLGVPNWLKPAIMTEYFIKIGLVCMGAEIMFQVVMKAGAVGLLQALLVVIVVWFSTYWLCRKFGLSERFSSIIATGNSICGVSASIAAGGAVQGDPKEVSYIVAWLMICAVLLIFIMPPLARWMAMPTNMAGAWVAGVIDNTGAVVAAGGILGSKAALDAAVLVKMSQNVLIGFAAFLLALWATLSLEKKSTGERPSYAEIWYRFPKFIVGFVVASLIVSFFVLPAMGDKGAKGITGLMKGYRTWLFAICFVCIGLETRVKELLAVGGGRPAIAYFIAQFFNIIWTLIVVYILWSGWLFTPPILPD